MWGRRCEEHCIHRCWHPSCWFLETRTALLLMTPAAVPIRSSSLSVSRPNQRPVIHGCREKLIDISSWTTSENLFTQWQDLFPVRESSRTGSFVSLFSVPNENPRCVSIRPRQNRRVCCRFKRRDFVFENCQICSGESTHCGDGFLRGSVALMALCGDTCR